jgi:shikimate kinase
MRPNLVLTGFMATGKTATGRLAAERLGLAFLDLDDEIERSEGRTISDLFAANGEAAFRAAEKRAVARAASRTGQVIATGGGAVLDPDNRAALEASGVLINLRASVETILARAEGASHRPLLQGDRKRAIEERLAKRSPVYHSIRLQVDTDGRTPADVADEVCALYRESGS